MIGIICSGSICGMVVLRNMTVWALVYYIINYIPFLILIIKNYNVNTIGFSRYPFTLGLTTFYVLLVFFVPNGRGYTIFTNRVLPLLMFLVFILFSKNLMDIKHFILILRYLLILSLIIYFLPNYSEQTNNLFIKYRIAKDDIPPYSILLAGLSKNAGYTFDPRTWGIVSYLYLFIVITYKRYKLRAFDILVSSIVCLTTLSRGSTGVLGLILISFFLKSNIKIVLFSFITIIVVMIILIKLETISLLNDYINTFNILSDSKTDPNAFSQRNWGRDIAIQAFQKNPIFGIGFGNLKAVYRSQISKYGGYVTDAYIYTVLAEVGIVGFVCFVCSYIELFIRKNIYVWALGIGIFISMIGTDIPDMRITYFFILITIKSIFKYNIIEKNPNYAKMVMRYSR
jgi:hypothetical protein